MKKGLQIAFAITLVILAGICTVFPELQLMESIVYAVIIPSFVLTIISFVVEISTICEKKAGKRADSTEKAATLAGELADQIMENYQAGIYEVPYVEGAVPKRVLEAQEEGLGFYRATTASLRVKLFFAKVKWYCDRIVVLGYVVLLLSLSLSPYIVQWLSVVNLDCITLWSLALLYITLEPKEEICIGIFEFLYKRAEKRALKDEDAAQTESTDETSI